MAKEITAEQIEELRKKAEEYSARLSSSVSKYRDLTGEHAYTTAEREKIIGLRSALTDYHTLTNARSSIKEACFHHNIASFDETISILADINEQDGEGRSVMMYAVLADFTYAIDKLITSFPLNLFLQDNKGNTVLHLAVISKRYDLIRKIVEKEPSIVTIQNNEGKLAFYLALEIEDTTSQALTYAQALDGESLLYAIRHHNDKIAQVLLARTPSLAHYKDLKNNTALSIAIQTGNKAIVDNLFSLGVTVIETIEANGELEALDLSNIRISTAEIFGTLNALPHNRFLLTLNLNGLALGPIIAENLFSGLKDNRTLQNLDISGNNLGARGAAVLEQLLLHNSSISYLNLANNSLAVEGLEYIASALKHNTSLKKLDISSNGLREYGAGVVEKILGYNSRLLEMNVSKNNIGDTGAILIAAGLEGNLNLARIDLSDNNIGLDGLTTLAEVLSINVSLVGINLYGNRFSPAVISTFVTAFHSNSSLISPIGIDDPEENLVKKILHNQASFRKTLKALEAVTPDTIRTCSITPKDLFTAFKQIQTASAEYIAEAEGKEFYLSKIYEVAHAILPTTGDETARGYLTGVTEQMSEAFCFDI